MAAAAVVQSPIDILVDKTLEAWNIADRFYNSKPIASGNSTEYTFPLEAEPFVNLQCYLIAASRLPDSAAAFESSYPRELFMEYIDKRAKTPADSKFYDKMQEILVGINNHCDKFDKTTMKDSVLVATQIANFAKQAGTTASTMENALLVLTRRGVRSDDLMYQSALAELSSSISILRVKVKNAEQRCQTVHDGLAEFKRVVEQDRVALDNIQKHFDKLIPTAADLDDDMRRRLNSAHKHLNSALHTKNKLEVRNKFSLRRLWTIISFDGIGAGWKEVLGKGQGAEEAWTALGSYQAAMSMLKTDVQRATHLRTMSRQLGHVIDHVAQTIQAAVTALKDMIRAFSTLTSNFDDIDGLLEEIASTTANQYELKRKGALVTLHQLSQTSWPMVVVLAERFVENGLMMKDVDTPPSPLSDTVEIISANWGANDVTDDAKVLFYDGANIRIRTVEPGFQDPWRGTVKTCSVLHRSGGSMRMFVCREYSGKKREHILRPGTIDLSDADDAQLLEIHDRVPPVPTGAKIEILAIVWGSELIENPQAYEYVYDCHSNGAKVKFANDTIGGGKDTWLDMLKSGTVYYRVQGGSQVHQVTGREGQEIGF